MVRKFLGQDGQEKIQLRLDLGLLQMNLRGRPDGRRPHGRASLLDYYRDKVQRYRQRHEGSDEGFALDDEACVELQLEAIQYHHRYLCLLQLEDYAGVVSDTERNLGLFDFVERYAAAEELIWALQQFRPQLLMMRARARSALALRERQFDQATVVVKETIEEIRSFYENWSQPDRADSSDEIQSLEACLEEIHGQRPLSEAERLEMALGEAIRREDYEKAALCRDALRNLKGTVS